MTEAASTPHPEGNKQSITSKVSGLFGGDNLAVKYRRWLQFEVVALCVLMVIVWGLLTLPIIFYYLPVPAVSRVSIITMLAILYLVHNGVGVGSFPGLPLPLSYYNAERVREERGRIGEEGERGRPGNEARRGVQRLLQHFFLA